MNKPFRPSGQLTISAKGFGRYASYQAIPLHKPDTVRTIKGKTVRIGKRPLDFNWTTRAYKTAEVIKRCVADQRNMGVRLRSTDLVLDMDLRHGGVEGLEDLCMDAGLDLSKYPRVVTGSGGLHLYGKKPADLLVVDTLPAFAGVEFKSKGRQVVAAGSVHPDTGKLYKFDDDFPPLDDAPGWPQELLDLIQRPERSGAAVGGGQYSQEQLAKALDKLDPEEFRDHGEWLRLMMACHHATNGDARDEFVEWSTSDPNYADDAEIIGRRWDSLHSEKPDGITYRTLNAILADHGAANATVAQDANADFEGAEIDEEHLQEDEEPSDADWSEQHSRGKYAKLKSWQWIGESMQFIHDDGLRMLNEKQFRMSFGKLCPKKNIAIEIERGKVPMKKFYAQVYIPKAEAVLKYEGRTVFNIWRPSEMTPKPGDHQWFLDHIAILFPNKTTRQHLLNYMAQLVQHPEVKIHFVLLLQSVEGVGKGALAQILRRIIGKRNCVEPSNDEVTKSWSGWQEGAQLAIINELMASGRTDVYNRLKSPITESTLRIEKKYGNGFTIPNHMNLFCMTNFKDALPVKEGDRRWLVLYSPAQKQPDSYYDGLWANIADDGKVAAVMDFLMHHTITFNPKAPAPWTAAKGEMQERAKSDVEADLQTLYDDGRPPFNLPLIRAVDIVEAIRVDRKHERNVYKEAHAFLDHVGAKKLRRYKKGKDGLPPVQLYAIRDHAAWDVKEPIDVARAYREQGMGADEDDGDKDDASETS